MSLFYTLKGSTSSIIIVSLVAIVSNYCFGKLLMPFFGAVGLALAMVFSCALQSFLLLWFFHRNFSMSIYIRPFFTFVKAAGKQLLLLILLFGLLYQGGIVLISYACTSALKTFFLTKMGFWLWTGPLCMMIGYLFYKTRAFFSVRLYFLD